MAKLKLHHLRQEDRYSVPILTHKEGISTENTGNKKSKSSCLIVGKIAESCRPSTAENKRSALPVLEQRAELPLPLGTAEDVLTAADRAVQEGATDGEAYQIDGDTLEDLLEELAGFVDDSADALR
jgi:hypothetical protein